MKELLKICLPAVLLLLITMEGIGQKYDVTIITPASVRIKGSSNINSFSLNYTKSVSGRRSISLGATENNRTLLKGDTKIALEVDAFTSSQSMITRDFKKMLKSDRYPFINIELVRIITNKDDLSKVHAMAVLTIANTRRLEILPVKVVKKGANSYSFTSTHKISLKNYNLQPPKKVMGMVSVNDEVIIEITLPVKYQSS